MTKTLIVFMSLATLAGHSLLAVAESCPPATRVLMRITGDDNLRYLTSRTSFDTADKALGTSWNADATSRAEHAFRIARLPVTQPEPVVSSGESDSRGPVAAAVTVTAIAEPALPAASVVNQPADAAASTVTPRFHSAIKRIQLR